MQLYIQLNLKDVQQNKLYITLNVKGRYFFHAEPLIIKWMMPAGGQGSLKLIGSLFLPGKPV